MIYRPNVKGPISHDYLIGPVVLSIQCFLFQMRDHRPGCTWEVCPQESTVTSCSVPSIIYTEAVTDTAQETATQGFPHCWPDPKISYEAEVMTDMVHPDTLKM